METPSELRQMFGLPTMKKELAESIGLQFDEFIVDVVLPVSVKKKYKARGKSWTSEENPQKSRWRCLDCGMESNITGIVRHHRAKGHIGKQRVLL